MFFTLLRRYSFLDNVYEYGYYLYYFSLIVPQKGALTTLWGM